VLDQCSAKGDVIDEEVMVYLEKSFLYLSDGEGEVNTNKTGCIKSAATKITVLRWNKLLIEPGARVFFTVSVLHCQTLLLRGGLGGRRQACLQHL